MFKFTSFSFLDRAERSNLNGRTWRLDRIFVGCPRIQSYRPNPAPHRFVSSKSYPKRLGLFARLPYRYRYTIAAITLVISVTVLWSRYLNGPFDVLEGLHQAVVYGLDSQCENGWKCDSKGDKTRWGVVR